MFSQVVFLSKSVCCIRVFEGFIASVCQPINAISSSTTALQTAFAGSLPQGERAVAVNQYDGNRHRVVDTECLNDDFPLFLLHTRPVSTRRSSAGYRKPRCKTIRLRGTHCRNRAADLSKDRGLAAVRMHNAANIIASIRKRAVKLQMRWRVAGEISPAFDNFSVQIDHHHVLGSHDLIYSTHRRV